jgi:hypothetical protein
MQIINRSFAAGATFLCLFASGVIAQQTNRDGRTPPTVTVGTAELAGTVVEDGPDARPLRRVTVTISLSSASAPSPQRVIATDDRGRFRFPNLPAGTYSAPRLTKPGYVSAAYGEKRVGGIGTPVTLAEGQRLTIAMKMLKGAVITGTIRDQGRPVPQTQVQATLVRVVNGERLPGSSMGLNSNTTDDQGTFRIYGLAPGSYAVIATPRLTGTLGGQDVRPITEQELQWAQQQVQGRNATAMTPSSNVPPKPAQAIAYAPVYYPGTAHPASAALVSVSAGEERSGVDFDVQYVSTARVEGVVRDLDGQPVRTGQVNLIPKMADNSLITDSFFVLDSMMMMRPTLTDGKFSLGGLRPGAYIVTVQTGGVQAGRAAMPPSEPLWGRADIDVDGVDLSGIEIRLERGMDLAGRIAFESDTLAPPVDLSTVNVRPFTAPTTGITVTVNLPTGQVEKDGTFNLKGMAPGRYLISANAPSGKPGATWLLKSARLGQADVADIPFEVVPGQNVSDVVLTFTDKVAEVSGTLRDATGTPTPALSIMLFSTDRTQWHQRSRRLRAPVRAATNGTFKFTNLLAGEYYIAALSDFEPRDVYKPDFLDQVAAAAMKITVAEGEKKVQDIKIAGGG